MAEPTTPGQMGGQSQLLVSEILLLNDRLGTVVQETDLQELLESFGLEKDGPISSEEFLRWYSDPDNTFVSRKKKQRFDVVRGEIQYRPSAEQFLLHKLRAHEINVPGTFEYRVAF